MAHEGSVMTACLVRLEAGQLVAERWQQRHRDTMIHQPAAALAKLLAGEAVWMRATGNQWTQLQELWAERQNRDISKTADQG